MSTNVIQTSFAGGELSPTLYARVDLTKYHIGAARLLNFFVDYRGGASNRPGFELVCRCKSSTSITRLIPFQFSTIQTYELIFSDLNMRVIKNGAQLLNTAETIAGISNANPGVIGVSAGHGYVVGQQIYFLVNGMIQLNAKDFFVAEVLNPSEFTIKDWNGTVINTSGFGTFTSGTVASVYEVVSPYASADLPLLKFTQSADVMTICHPSYPPYDLTRTGDTAWTFTAVVIGSSATAPGAPTVTVAPATAGTVNYSYKITSVNAAGQESVASSAGTATNKINIATTPGSVGLTWLNVAGAISYNVYKALPSDGTSIPTGALYGFMTTVTTNAAVDTNIVPDFAFAPPTNTNPFAAGNDPIAVTYDQQRKVYAGSTAFPETFWMSKPGQFNNFDISDPIQPSDSIVGTLVSRQVNNIKYMVSMPGGLIMLTGGGAWQVSGGAQGAVLSPSTITATPQAYNGCADVEPLTINYDILYVQQKGTVVRDLSYSFYTNIYTGNDLSVLSNHFFTGYSIKEWTYAEEPFKLVWAVRSDGALLSLTYLKEQEVFGWAKHETQGRFQSISSIQEGQENAVYAVVQRFVNNEQVSFVERLHSRLMPYGSEDAFFVDCALSTVPFVDASAFGNLKALNTVIGSGGFYNVFTEGSPFNPDYVGTTLRMAGGIASVVSYVDQNNIIVQPIKPFTDIDFDRVPEHIWPQLEWSFWSNVTIVSGLDHLEGETVSILGDGNVFPDQVVVNGSITLSQPCSKIHVGLSYKAQLQTLYLDTGDPTIQGKRKNIIAMTMRVDQTRGLEAGNTFDDLTAYKDRDLNTIGRPIDLFTGDQRLLIGGGWTTEAQICIEQSNPLPATILGVIPEIQLGDSGK